MKDILNKLSVEDFEKLKWLFSMSNNQQPKEVVTLRVFIDEYSNWVMQNRSKAYHVSVMSSFKHLLDFFGGQKSIREIGLKGTESFCTYLQQKVRNGYLVYYRTLKAAFNKAVEWEYIKENYFLKVKLPKKQKLAPAFINSDELLSISDKVNNKIVKDLIVFAFYTGMRLDEIVNLRWENIDLVNRVITVGDAVFTTKGRNQRFVPICEEAFEILVRRERSSVKSETGSVNETIPHDSKPVTRLIRLNQTVGNSLSGSTASSSDSEIRLTIGSLRVTNGFVFCKPDGRKYTGDHISQCFKRACKAADLDNAIHFHSLRHSFASNLVQRGVPLYTIKELLGHSSVSTTEIYSHLNMDSLREAVNKLDTGCKLLDAGQKQKNEPQIFSINSGEKR